MLCRTGLYLRRNLNANFVTLDDHAIALHLELVIARCQFFSIQPSRTGNDHLVSRREYQTEGKRGKHQPKFRKSHRLRLLSSRSMNSHHALHSRYAPAGHHVARRQLTDGEKSFLQNALDIWPQLGAIAGDVENVDRA